MSAKLHITVTGQDNKQSEIPAEDGWSVMEVIRDNGVKIRADCGGCCACATCHVYVGDEWIDKLEPMNSEEDGLLSDSFYRQQNSRLSCQIRMTDDKDGLTVTIAPDAV